MRPKAEALGHLDATATATTTATAGPPPAAKDDNFRGYAIVYETALVGWGGFGGFFFGVFVLGVFGVSGGFGWGVGFSGFEVFVVEDGVEHHAELAYVLPAPDGVGDEEDNFAFAYWGGYYGGAAFDLVGAVGGAG